MKRRLLQTLAAALAVAALALTVTFAVTAQAQDRVTWRKVPMENLVFIGMRESSKKDSLDVARYII